MSEAASVVRAGWAEPSPADAQRLDPAEVFAAGLRNHHIANTAYPIAHGTTWKPYRVPRPRHREVVERAFARLPELCLYVHVPFCEVRCSFCEYTVVPRSQLAQQDEYVDALLAEIALWDQVAALPGRVVGGLDIGGGTPSMLSVRNVERVLAAVRSRVTFAPGADISIETTPKIAAAEPDKLRAWRAAGVDRVSMGVQVIQPDLLRVLRREGNGVEQHERAVAHVRAAGFERFNVDLMYGFADQSLASWEATLDHAIALGPEYITLYRMRYKLTRISDQASRVTLDVVRPMQILAKQKLAAAGYHANAGKTTYSRIAGDVGTSAYLARRVRDMTPYVGFGLGAQSFSDTTISYAAGAAGKDLAPYLRAVGEGVLPLQDLYHLPRAHVMGKACAVSFYFGEIRCAPFERKFGVALEGAFPDEVDFVLREGWMHWTGDGETRALSLTPEGALHKNGVIPLFAAPSIQRYLVARDPAAAEDLARSRRVALRVADRA